MPYVFAVLVAINVLALGYFTFLHTPKPTQSLIEAKSSLSHPIDFENSSAEAPLQIGEK